MAEKTSDTIEKNSPPQFEMKHLYLKDVSFEAPNSPAVFQKKWEPQLSIDVHQEHKAINEETHEISLGVSVTVKLQDVVAYIVEVKHAGIFMVKNFNDQQLQHFLQVFCPGFLYPYLREAVSTLVLKGGFSPLYIAPINFEAIFRKKLEENA